MQTHLRSRAKDLTLNVRAYALGWVYKSALYTVYTIIIIIIIIISIFKEDKVFSIIASLPYGPPVNTDFDYYRTFFGLFLFL